MSKTNKNFKLPLDILVPSDEETYTLIPGDAVEFFEWAFAVFADEFPFEIWSGRNKELRAAWQFNDEKLMELYRDAISYYPVTNGRFGLDPDLFDDDWIKEHWHKENDSTIYYITSSITGKFFKGKYTSESVKKFVIETLNIPDFFDTYLHGTIADHIEPAEDVESHKS